MTARDHAPTGAPCWIDLFTSDVDAAVAFYGDLLGWTADEPNPEFGGYTNFRHDGEWVAGMMANDPSWGAPDAWSVYLATSDAAATVQAVTAHGATVSAGPQRVGELGTMVVIDHPAAGGVGFWEPGEHEGFRTFDEPGTPSHFELHTPAYAEAIAFYRDAVGWTTTTMSDTDDFRYTGAEWDGETLAGIMDRSDLPPGSPARWAIYFRVTDVDAALIRIPGLGGTVEAPAADTPYGRLAEAADPTGVRFRVVSG
ncbi:MAG: VOC family protein [Acidimicrobiales bacterium]|jgi:predicted enzyme related to lactoylglutathione lyase|nr:VOC family protein [Acidimicrobiales bacterium]